MSRSSRCRFVRAFGFFILAIFAAGCGTSAGAHTPTAAATATMRPAPTATSAPIPNFPLSGWRQGGPANATAIAFAPGSPNVAYTCGTIRTPVAGAEAPMFVSVSTDGAKTWTTRNADAAESSLCSLSVDPANAQDVVLYTTTCVQNCTSDPVTHLYRSQDQGRSWRELALPQLPADGAGPPYFTNALAWSGQALFAETLANVSGGHPIAHLLASVNAAPFTRVDQAALFSNASVTKLFTTGTALYVALFPTGCTATYFCTLAKTTDGGATWHQVSLRYQSQPVDLLAGGPSLIVGTPSGAIEHAQIARTANDGQSWQAIPATPAGLAYYEAPDGTLMVTALDSGSLYELAPGASHWQLAVTAPMAMPTSIDDGLLVFQYNAAGHPVAVWRDAGQDQSNNFAQYPGLQLHSL